jgi:hypothetical protein
MFTAQQNARLDELDRKIRAEVARPQADTGKTLKFLYEKSKLLREAEANRQPPPLHILPPRVLFP